MVGTILAGGCLIIAGCKDTKPLGDHDELGHAPEIEPAAKLLPKRRMFVRGYRGLGANVRAISEMVDLFTYDLLIFATHCGDASGWRWTCEFRDSEGLDRLLIVDIAIGVGQTDDDEMLRVMKFINGGRLKFAKSQYL